MNKMFSALLIPILFIVGCAGKTPNPVQTHRAVDYHMSCSSLLIEMDEIEAKIRTLVPDTQKTGKNVGLGVAGCFLLVPWFFMDFSDAERIEIESLRARYNHLTRLYLDKGCGNRDPIPKFQSQTIINNHK